MLITHQGPPSTAQVDEPLSNVAPASLVARPSLPGNAEPALERSAFDELVREIGQDGACEVRAVFWTETSARLKLFHELAFAQHHAKIERLAHSLKSAARTFGYRQLASLALQLEKDAATLSEAEYHELLKRMDAAYAAALEQESLI